MLYRRAFGRTRNDGHSAGGIEHRSGEAWQGGPIVLSWHDALRGGRNEDDGQNVVIHEFAHALDGLDGEMGGSIAFDSNADAANWHRVVNREYAQLVDAAQHGRDTILDHYGAKNRAEFFAVATETFFEQPQQLQRTHTELFSMLQKYYHVNPIAWQRQ